MDIDRIYEDARKRYGDDAELLFSPSSVEIAVDGEVVECFDAPSREEEVRWTSL